jgi:hypothetical protein
VIIIDFILIAEESFKINNITLKLTDYNNLILSSYNLS